MRVGIVGNSADKFDFRTEFLARDLIFRILSESAVKPVLVSGGCHLGGVDIWAEEAAREINVLVDIKLPKRHNWNGGYRERNLLIARDSDIVHAIVVKEYPPSYSGQRFNQCYHCEGLRPAHVKSGACWTAIRAMEMGKKAKWHILE